MAGIAMSSSRLLAYGIFISCVIDHLDIDKSDVEKLVMIPRKHLVGEFLIHKMSIYKHNNEWMYQEDHRTTVDLDLSDEDHQAEASDIPQGPSFRLAHLDAMELRLNERTDGIMAEFHRQEQLNQNQFEQLTIMLRNMGGFSQPPPDEMSRLNICVSVVDLPNLRSLYDLLALGERIGKVIIDLSEETITAQFVILTALVMNAVKTLVGGGTVICMTYNSAHISAVKHTIYDFGQTDSDETRCPKAKKNDVTQRIWRSEDEHG
ncbi:hypothetical protein Lal_00000789 [Lupinus albus]|nr:hypothetical protein Lal_00000789 [Lupinus albus]